MYVDLCLYTQLIQSINRVRSLQVRAAAVSNPNLSLAENTGSQITKKKERKLTNTPN